MWPKALSQLVELAPHVTRLLPLADRYFKDKASSDDAAQRAMADLQTTHESALEAQRSAVKGLGDRLQAELGTLIEQHTIQAATLQRQVTDLEKHLAGARADALAAKQATESLEGRLASIEGTQRRAQTLAVVALVFLAAILTLMLILFLHTR